MKAFILFTLHFQVNFQKIPKLECPYTVHYS